MSYLLFVFSSSLEKDGLWAAIAWMSIIMKVNADTPNGSPLVSVKNIVKKHWAKFGRHFYCRYDYENVDSDAANKVMELIRESFINTATIEEAGSEIKFVNAEEFS